jgi:hypothetical protein
MNLTTLSPIMLILIVAVVLGAWLCAVDGSLSRRHSEKILVRCLAIDGIRSTFAFPRS